MNQPIDSKCSLMSVVQMNMKGIEQLQDGKYVVALRLFHLGIQMLLILQGECPSADSETCSPQTIDEWNALCYHQSDLVEDRDETMRSLSPSLLHPSSETSIIAIPEKMFTPAPCTLASTAITPGINIDDQGHSILLFSRALHFADPLWVGFLHPGADGACVRILMGGILFYNVGLASHLQGLHAPTSRRCLMDAMQYYELSRDAFYEQIPSILNAVNTTGASGIGYGSIHLDCLWLPLAALANNAGHIYEHCGTFRLVDQYRNELILRLCTALFSSTTALHSRGVVLIHAEWKIFLYNALWHSESYASPAA